MGLKWVRIDTALARNPKILDLIEHKNGRESAFVYVAALGYSGEHDLDGFIPRTCLPFIHGRKADMDRLVENRLLVVDPDGGGWIAPDWAEYQPTNAETQARSARARTAAGVRWSAKQKGKPAKASPMPEEGE